MKSPFRARIARIAEAKVSSGMTPIVTSPRSSDARSRAPAGMRRLSAEKASRSPFCSATERPKVTSSGWQDVLAQHTVQDEGLCNSQPSANISGAASSAATQGDRPSRVTPTSTR